MTRLRLSALLILLLLCTVAAACGDDDDAGSAASVTAATEAAAAAFPVTIEHKYGTTELAERPERVVTVGLNEQDAFFALGVAPVGVTDWMGFENGIGPWAEAAAKAAGDPPELLTNTDGIQFEKIAALRPDVIVALYTDLEKADYEKLSQIAPVVAPPEGHADCGIDWQDTVADRRRKSRAAGRSGEGHRRRRGAPAQAKATIRSSPARRPRCHVLDGMCVRQARPALQAAPVAGFELSPELVAAVGDTSRPRSAARRPICSPHTLVCCRQKDLTRSPPAASTTACVHQRSAHPHRDSGPQGDNAIGSRRRSASRVAHVLVPALAKHRV